VTIVAGGRTFHVRTNARGAFRVTLTGVATDRCSLGMVATGARGDRAIIAARTMCAPATSP
jgi:hypothetical protein